MFDRERMVERRGIRGMTMSGNLSSSVRGVQQVVKGSRIGERWEM